MARSESFLRGWRKAIQAAAAVAGERASACERAAARYGEERPDDPYWERSERCARLEAQHISEEILKLERRWDGEKS